MNHIDLLLNFHPVTQRLISPQILLRELTGQLRLRFVILIFLLHKPILSPSREIDESIFLNDTSCVRVGRRNKS